MKNFTNIEQAVSSLENVEVLETPIYRRKDYSKSMSSGNTIFDTKNEKAKDEVQRVADAILR